MSVSFSCCCTFRHEPLEDALRLADQLFRDAQLGQTGAGEIIFVIAEQFLPDGEQAARAGFFQGRRACHEEQRFVLETDLDAVSAEGAFVLPEDAALGILHDLVEIIRGQLFADDADREPADELRLETVFDEILGADVLENFVIEDLDRLGFKTNLALRETL